MHSPHRRSPRVLAFALSCSAAFAIGCSGSAGGGSSSASGGDSGPRGVHADSSTSGEQTDSGLGSRAADATTGPSDASGSPDASPASLDSEAAPASGEDSATADDSGTVVMLVDSGAAVDSASPELDSAPPVDSEAVVMLVDSAVAFDSSSPEPDSGHHHPMDSGSPEPDSSVGMDSGPMMPDAGAILDSATGMDSAMPRDSGTVTPMDSGSVSTGTGKTYYLAANGNDQNSGTSASSPWLTPKHAINCGDTILAAASTQYQASSFVSWGNVSCPSGDNVAWLTCEAFDACKITTSNYAAMQVDASYWGVQGWEVSNTGGSCFVATPATSGTTIHHIIFANDVATGCANGGFGSDPFEGAAGPAGVDYLAIVGNLAYDSALGASECFSGISVYEPQSFDTAAGTHIYVAENLSWSNVDSPSCPGNTDGEGIIFDDWSGSQSHLPAFTGQGVAENNLLVGNGGPGIEVFLNTSANVVFRNNTTYGNDIDPTHKSTDGEGLVNSASTTTVAYNLFDAITKTVGGTSSAYYAFIANAANGTDSIDYNWASGTGGNNELIQGSSGIAFGAHEVSGTSPGFASPHVPGAPSCSGTASTHACMASAFAGFAPSASGTSGVGYQPVTATYAANAYFPAWLCGASLPSGVVSNYCP